jgi:hypothetical protein
MTMDYEVPEGFLTLPDIRAWAQEFVEAHGPEAVIGHARSDCACPIQHYITDRLGLGEYGGVLVSSRVAQIDDGHVHFSDGVQNIIAYVDAAPVETPVSAQEFLTLVEEECRY